jgi:hypothetical protein
MGIRSLALYLDAQYGATAEELSKKYDLPIDRIQERLEAAVLLFQHQVARIEFNLSRRADKRCGKPRQGK